MSTIMSKDQVEAAVQRMRIASAARAVIPAEDDFETRLAAEVERLRAGGAQTRHSAEEFHAHELETEIFPRMKNSNWEVRFRRELLGDWGCPRQKAVFDICREAFTRKGSVMALVGVRGAGKTTIGAQLALTRAWEDYRSGYDPAVPTTCRATPYRKLTDLLGRFKALYAEFGTLEPERLMDARNILCRDHDLLVIDEIHECAELKARERILTDLIDRRYARRNDTLLICNLTDEEFRRSMDDSVLSRISEHGEILECTWPSWRANG